MSFVTVFTASTMAFVLLVPALMIVALATLSPLRRGASAPVHGALDTFSDREDPRKTEPQLLPVAA